MKTAVRLGDAHDLFGDLVGRERDRPGGAVEHAHADVDIGVDRVGVLGRLERIVVTEIVAPVDFASQPRVLDHLRVRR